MSAQPRTDWAGAVNGADDAAGNGTVQGTVNGTAAGSAHGAAHGSAHDAAHGADRDTAHGARRQLRVLPIPDTEPPALGGELHGYHGPGPDGAGCAGARLAGLGLDGSGGDTYVQGVLAVDFRGQHDDWVFGPQATASADLPDPTEWARRMIRAILEAMDGLRPSDQLTRWVAPEIHARIQRRGTLSRRRHERVRHVTDIRTVRVCVPADGIAEIAAVVVHQSRVRALALRLSGVDGRWLITAFELG